MSILKPSDAGRTVNGEYSTGGRAIPFDGKIQTYDGTYYLCTNIEEFNDGRPLPDRYGYAFSFRLGNIDLRRINDYVGTILRLSLAPEIVIWFKNGQSGMLFRRVYKIDSGMIYMGTIQKDPDLCVDPSAVIHIYDKQYMEAQGWKLHEKEPTAEQKVKAAALSKRNG